MPMTPHLIWAAAEAFTRGKYKPFYSINSFFIKDRKGRWGFAEQDLDRVGEFFFKNPEEIIKLAELWGKKLQKFNEITKRIKDLSELPDKELYKLYWEFYNAYVDQYSVPALVNTLDFYFENWLKTRADQKEFFVLTAPGKESFIQKEMRELKESKIEEHVEKYFWLGNNYAHTEVLGKDYFLRRKDEEINIFKKIDKKELMNKYNISEDLMKSVEECIYLRDERKKYNMIGNHYLVVFLGEIGKRNNISLEDMKYTLPNEIENINKEKIKLRKQPYLVIMTPDEDFHYYGQEAQELHDKMFNVQHGKVNEIQGRPACLGRARGTVKVIMDESGFSRMKEGDILVTSMTRPEFVPIMKKAAAIITDEGGITCHAAIVSRELNIPCIISTRIATQKLKDGDKVEVDADKGVVRKV